MTSEQPTTTLQPEFSGADAVATLWATVREELARAEIAWLTTVRPDGRPHVTPLLFIWQDGALYFCTGAEERKARNLAQNAHCVLTTGCNALNEGRDLVVEGDAVPVCDTAILQRLAERYAAKYDWHFTVRDGAFLGDEGNTARVYAVSPQTVFAFGKGDSFSQTRYRF
jgi:general stress protein 26